MRPDIDARVARLELRFELLQTVLLAVLMQTLGRSQRPAETVTRMKAFLIESGQDETLVAALCERLQRLLADDAKRKH